MKKFVTSTLALAAAGSLGYAGPGDSEWSGLDSQLNTIRSSYAADGGLGSQFGAVLSVSFVSLDDDIDALHPGFTSAGGEDVLAVDLSYAIAWLEGEVNPEVNWRVSLDLYDSAGGVSLYEAYIDVKLGGGLFRAGMQLVPTARHLAFAPENRLFGYAPIALTDGTLDTATWDEALTWIGSGDSFAYNVAVANDGGDADDDEWTLIAKGTWMNAEIDAYEGPFGNSDDGGIAVSLYYVDQGAVADGTTLGVDFTYDASNWSVSGGFLDNDTGVGDNSPFFVQGGLTVGENGVVGLRYADSDNAAEWERITAVYQNYADNQNHTWSVELGQDETTATDGTFIALNVTAGNFGNYQDPITGLR